VLFALGGAPRMSDHRPLQYAYAVPGLLSAPEGKRQGGV
jgi:hypothetical protein